MKLNITLAIRATDDTARVKEMLEFLRSEGFSLTQTEVADSPVRSNTLNVVPSVLAKYGPNEIEWRAANPNTRSPVWAAAMKAAYPNRDDMFKAALDGTLTQAAISAASQEPNASEGGHQMGAVLTVPFVMPEPDENDY
jgi:hypothetical protein